MVEIIFEIAPLRNLIFVSMGFNAPQPYFQVQLSVYPRLLSSACRNNIHVYEKLIDKGNFLLVNPVKSFLQICLHACIVWRGLLE